MALCRLLAFWTGGDAARVDRLFRQSGSIREKWDDVHYSDGSTYGEKTVERAIVNTDDVYDSSSKETSGEGIIQREPRDGSTSTEQTVGGTDGARAAYLAEKNQLLSERVADLEATLEEKNDRLEELEADNRTLRERRDACEDQLEELDRQSEFGTGDNLPARTDRSGTVRSDSSETGMSSSVTPSDFSQLMWLRSFAFAWNQPQNGVRSLETESQGL